MLMAGLAAAICVGIIIIHVHIGDECLVRFTADLDCCLIRDEWMIDGT